MSADIRQGWKIVTHDYRPPVQGGEPVWDGTTLPWTLPAVSLDTSEAEYGTGWHYCADLATALAVARLWPTGWPSVPVRIEASQDALPRGRKYRASQLAIVRRATDAEITAAIHELSAPFGAHQDQMAAEQLAWREALGRPRHDRAAVERGLREALEARGLAAWRLQRYETARDARAAWAAWAAWDARDARAARAAWAARAARAALTLTYAALAGWVTHPPDLLSRGLRDAYRHGLAVAVPVHEHVLGYTMVSEEEEVPA